MNLRALPLLLLLTPPALAQPLPYSQRMADAMLVTHRDSVAYVKEGKSDRWDYETGVLLRGIELVWNRTADARYFDFIQRTMDRYVQPDGSIRTYRPDEFNIDHVTPGRALLLLYQQTLPNREKYRKAADLLRRQLARQPRTKEGGFWHKKRYPNQMWLDGLYMAEPFYAEYSAIFKQPEAFDDIANQFVWMEQHARDAKTGLLYHGWDESREQKWANPQTGTSPNFWSRAMGWYAMALVDVLDYFPQNHPRRGELLAIFQRLMPAVVKYQDAKDGGWYQVTNRGGDKGNYLEASATGMFVYTLAKGVRLGYLNPALLDAAKRGYAGMLKNFISTDASGGLHLEKTVLVSGLGGSPYRDGSYEYYLSEPLRQDDLKGVGPFIMASVEMEIAAENAVGKGKTVAVDGHFNREFRKGFDGQPEPFHYTWEDRMHSGFFFWGNAFRELGASLATVGTAPTAASLRGVDVFIVVDPDTPKETANPNYVSDADVRALTDWVKAGGVLVLMANDTANCEIPRFNRLAGAFGMQFTAKNKNMVQGTAWEQGLVRIPPGTGVFQKSENVYIKELSPLSVKAPAKPLVTDGGDVIMATARFGKGTVFAVGDPWLYNEYTDGRRIPARYQNFLAGKELAAWLLSQARTGAAGLSATGK